MPKKSKTIWKDEEDEFIMKFVQIYGTKKWVFCSQLMKKNILKKKNSSECRERWFNHLDPQIQKKGWTLDQQKILLDNIDKYGSKWCQVCKALPGRTQNSVKNKFYSILRSLLRLLAKNQGKVNHKIIKLLSPNDLMELYNFQNVNKINILKYILITLQFEVYKQSLTKFLKGKQNLLVELFQQIQRLQKKHSYNELQNNQNKSQLGSENNTISNRLSSPVAYQFTTKEQDSQNKTKYFLLNAYLPVYLSQNNIIKLGYQQNLIQLLKNQLKKLDVNYFLQKQN